MRPSLLILLATILAMAWFVIPQRRSTAQAEASNEPKSKAAQPAKPVPASQPQADDAPKHYRPATLPESVRRKAEAVAARHRGMSKQQFAQSAEMQQLGAQFSKHLEPPEFQAKLKQAIEAMKAVNRPLHTPFPRRVEGQHVEPSPKAIS